MPNQVELARTIELLWERRGDLGPATSGEARYAVDAALGLLDSGEARVASRLPSGEWETHQWLKKAVLLSFRLYDNARVGAAPGPWWDKVPLKFAGWTDDDFRRAGFRAVPGAIVRRGAYVAPGAVLIPSFVNIGAYVGESARTVTFPAAQASAAFSNPCRQILSSLRTIASLERAPKSPRALSYVRGRCSLWASISASLRRSSTANRVRFFTAKSQPIQWLSPGLYPRQRGGRRSTAR